MAGLADRETYTFYEHYYLVSPHKTHEEGWFMMRVRSMLYMESGKELHLLPGIPRAWMNGRISFTGMCSRLGKISLDVQPNLYENRVRVRIEHDGAASRLVLRIPHPEGRHALCATGGELLEDGETVLIKNPHGETWIELTY